MSKTETIDKAIRETLKVHPDYVDIYASTLNSIIQTKVNPLNFTAQNGVRKSIEDCEPIDFLKYVLDQLNRLYGALTVLYPKVLNGGNMNFYEWNSLCKSFPEANRIIELTYEIEQIKGNVLSYFKADQSKLFYLIETVLKVRFSPRFYTSQNGVNTFENNGDDFRRKIDTLASRSPEYPIIQEKIEQSYKPFSKIESVNFNAQAINRCVREIQSGYQVRYRHNEYSVDDQLFATQDIGKQRKNQEDSTLIMTHPNNKNFKILAVADGMGGASYGEEVSNFIVKSLSEWFAELPQEYYYSLDKLYNSLVTEVYRINDEVVDKYNNTQSVKAGSTLVCAIVTDRETLILNIGDSRAYTVNNGQLNLITEDESLVWFQLKERLHDEHRQMTMDDVSDLRFAPNNNQITKSIGYPGLSTPQAISIPNESYDKLLLFSDGVHDVLSSKDISIIANTTKPDQITKVIVETALNKTAEKKNKFGKVEQIVNAGKDNTTAAAYVRR